MTSEHEPCDICYERGWKSGNEDGQREEYQRDEEGKHLGYTAYELARMDSIDDREKVVAQLRRRVEEAWAHGDRKFIFLVAPDDLTNAQVQTAYEQFKLALNRGRKEIEV